MRILVSNDDGIDAPGLEVMEAIARDLSDDVWVVAPEEEKSGAGRAITLTNPLRIREIDDKRFALDGTPTDCVYLAIRHLMKDNLPDLVLSGVNRGANMADDITLSGTIGAAMGGTAFGIRSIAFSQAYGFDGTPNVKWHCGRHYGAGVVKQLLASEWPEDVLFNVNFPDTEIDKVAGIDVTKQGKRDDQTIIPDDRIDGRGVPYFWFTFQRVVSNPAADTDLYSIYNDRISVTPLHMNLTRPVDGLSLSLPDGNETLQEAG